MDLTYSQLLNFPDAFMEKSAKYYQMVELISKEQCDKYDVKELTDKVEKRFKMFKDAKYIYKYPEEKYYTSITPDYTAREIIPTANKGSKHSKKIDIVSDNQLWVEKLYYSLMDTITTKLTKQEAVYLIDCFFKNIGEEEIADKLSICKVTLQRIKKSCLVKVWVEMEALVEFEDWK